MGKGNYCNNINVIFASLFLPVVVPVAELVAMVLS